MGRYYGNNKSIVEDSLKLSIFKLKEFGLLRGYASSTLTWASSLSGSKSTVGIGVNIISDPAVKVNYSITSRHTGQKADYEYTIPLTTTDCHFGGIRYWFLCPCCGKRSGCLYKAPGGEYFHCRDCNRLTYESRNECRLGRFGQMGYVLKAERQVRELQEKIKRWTWAGRPTRKARRINTLTQRIGSYGPMDWERMLIRKR
ncbi:MAG: hypothetical protein JW860_00395 [Sedimentisphaerales bacterium]|nr:hypothetical protein [Sedimentisphaerales bacterium]